ncbi:uncharacterized protein LOC127868128 [Dreissena polymorpha]|uniref:uncharacterized protein LOC127868128 n=1 Tax=Dreissena polymorpha TaxID=45954 RepID=UPI002264B33C|nr:uncharacterized protein LOC127868128 [Dreissena polymorpha]
MCSLPSGHVIIADNLNENVKLLDQHYKVSSHCDLSSPPTDICQITSSEVAVSHVNGGVQFISVRNGQLVKGRKFQLPHKAEGIAHHKGTLYVTSGKALYHYALTGTLIKKLYENTEHEHAVFKCAVSLAGDRLYVINAHHKLCTLATDGSLLSTIITPFPFCVHITPAGQVLVCGLDSHTVIQVDHEGRKELVTLASQKDGLIKPVSICCNTSIQQIIVGLHNNNTIMVMKLQ